MAERTKRQRLKPEVRRERLLEAATEVFAERGYEGARVEQIADVAQVSPGLLYRHFEGKQELYEELLLLANKQLLEHLAQAAAPDLATDQRVLRGLDAFFSFVESHRNLWRLIMKDVVEPEIAAIREDVVRRSVALVAALAALESDVGGTQPHEKELEMVSVIVVGAVVSLAAWWMDHPKVPRNVIVAVAMEGLWVGLERARAGERYSVS
ncbi:MAG: TetR/AcrR family transcriptional regulator [Solirubrobacterales bacterium]